MASSDLWKMLYLPIFILITNGTIGLHWVRPGASWYGTKLLMQDHLPTQSCDVLTQCEPPAPPCTPCEVGHVQWAPHAVEWSI